MVFQNIARALDLPSAELEALMDGQAGQSVARRLGVTAFQVQEFLDGEDAPALAERIGVPMLELTRFRNRLGWEGAVGLLMGMLIPVKHDEA
ncbi:MAG: hypothetical protein ACOC83_00985 [Gemmatimonadota bacterium]